MRTRADLSPPLGYPGGPCQVVERIEKKVGSPSLKRKLEEEVMRNDGLSNPEASKVYRLLTERGVGRLKKMSISPHAQYRMDLRGVNVSELRLALGAFQKDLNDWKSQRDGRYSEVLRLTRAGDAIPYLYRKLGLFLAFRISGDVAIIVTTYWKGERDPRAPKVCIPRATAELVVRTVLESLHKG